jgi:hypothetical protein
MKILYFLYLSQFSLLRRQIEGKTGRNLRNIYNLQFTLRGGEGDLAIIPHNLLLPYHFSDYKYCVILSLATELPVEVASAKYQSVTLPCYVSYCVIPPFELPAEETSSCTERKEILKSVILPAMTSFCFESISSPFLNNEIA